MVVAVDQDELRACVLAVSGDPDRALCVLQDASAAGAWWRPEILSDDDDLAAVHGRPEFGKLLALSAGRVSDDVVPALIDVPDRPRGVLAPALRELPDTAAGKLSPATIWIGTDDDLRLPTHLHHPHHNPRHPRSLRRNLLGLPGKSGVAHSGYG